MNATANRPGYVNGVRIVWPEIRKIEPEGKRCVYGHTEGRDAKNRCVTCAHEASLRYQAKKKAAKEAVGAPPKPKAKRIGRPKFKPGDPCKHGHPYDRTDGGRCRACNREAAAKWAAAHVEERNAWKRESRAGRKARAEA